MKDQAEQIFFRYVSGEHFSEGLFNHSHNVAKIAEKIAEHTKDLDSDKAYAYGLLHDIGRYPGDVSLNHITIGYKLLLKEGLEDAARIALTHTFYEGQDWEVFWDEKGLTDDEKQFVMDYLNENEFNDYDRLIQLADNMATVEKITTVEDRFADVLTRHTFDHPEDNLRALQNLKKYFDEKTGLDIYTLFSMNILAIESSCDETAAAVISGTPETGPKILSNVVVSQIDIFKEYGGVIPEVAARSHLEAIIPVVNKALKDAGKTWDDIDSIAVTHTPGLLGSLLIGTLTARTLAILHNKPLYPIHHLKSHIYAAWLETEEKPQFPILSLVVSGGHTQILYMKEHNHFEIIGTTRDDAVGECFDKVAKILGLPYPGGPAIAKAAEGGDENKYHFPHPHLTSPARGQQNYSDLDFSFSGLKTAVLRKVQEELNLPLNHPSFDLKNHLREQQIKDFAASFQKTAIDILLENLKKAYEKHPEVKSIVIAGGVSANSLLREKALQMFAKQCPVFFPDKQFSGDNAAMVGAAALYEIANGVKPTDPYHLDILPRSQIY